MQYSAEAIVTVIEREKIPTLYAEFNYLWALNGAFSVDFLLIFIITEADSAHTIRNNRILKTYIFGLTKGNAMACWYPLNTLLFIAIVNLLWSHD